MLLAGGECAPITRLHTVCTGRGASRRFRRVNMLCCERLIKGGTRLLLPLLLLLLQSQHPVVGAAAGRHACEFSNQHAHPAPKTCTGAAAYVWRVRVRVGGGGGGGVAPHPMEQHLAHYGSPAASSWSCCARSVLPAVVGV